MPREADVVHALIEMADTLVEDFDVIDVLTGLTDRCVKVLGVSAAGVMLVAPTTKSSNWLLHPMRRCESWSCSNCRPKKGPALTPSERADPLTTRSYGPVQGHGQPLRPLPLRPVFNRCWHCRFGCGK